MRNTAELTKPFTGKNKYRAGAAKKKMVKKPKKAMKGKGMIGGAMIGGAKKKANPWIVFVKKFAKENGLTYPEALRAAAPYYKK